MEKNPTTNKQKLIHLAINILYIHIPSNFIFNSFKLQYEMHFPQSIKRSSFKSVYYTDFVIGVRYV